MPKLKKKTKENVINSLNKLKEEWPDTKEGTRSTLIDCINFILKVLGGN